MGVVPNKSLRGMRGLIVVRLTSICDSGHFTSTASRKCSVGLEPGTHSPPDRVGTNSVLRQVNIGTARRRRPPIPSCYHRTCLRQHHEEDTQASGGAETAQTPPIIRAKYNSATPIRAQL